jgi:hypothetical protein
VLDWILAAALQPKMTTPHLNIPYYVGKKFEGSITQKASEIEYVKLIS